MSRSKFLCLGMCAIKPAHADTRIKVSVFSTLLLLQHLNTLFIYVFYVVSVGTGLRTGRSGI